MASQRMLFLVALVLAVALGCQGARIVCHTNEECSPCKTGKPLCAGGLCTCKDNIGIHNVDYPGEKLNKASELASEEHCVRDKDCHCPPKCRSIGCMDGACFCSC